MAQTRDKWDFLDEVDRQLRTLGYVPWHWVPDEVWAEANRLAEQKLGWRPF